MTGHTFRVIRDIDHSGISGTGDVAEGWESSDGNTVVLKWRGKTPSVCIYSDIRHIEAIHGHGGDTRIVFDSPRDPETEPTTSNPGMTWENHDDPEVNR
jgi:hypothetical protein